MARSPVLVTAVTLAGLFGPFAMAPAARGAEDSRAGYHAGRPAPAMRGAHAPAGSAGGASPQGVSASAGSAGGASLRGVSVLSGGYAHPSGEMLVSVAARGGPTTQNLTVSFRLGVKPKAQASDVLLQGTLSMRAKAKATVTGSELATLPGDPAEMGLKYVMACLGKTCVAAPTRVTVTVTPVTSRDLIQAAETAGKLDLNTAMEYRVFAAFGDPRLPQRYQGDDLGPVAAGDPYVMEDVQSAWPKLSAQDQATLLPYFVPPAAKGSWANLPKASSARRAPAPTQTPTCSPLDKIVDSKWTYLDAPGGKVRIWWYKSDTADAEVAGPLGDLIASKIWPKYQKLMGGEPLPDNNEPCFHGGSGAYDVYLVNFVSVSRLGAPRALTVSYPGECTGTPAYTLFSTSHGVRPPSGWEMAHEMFHAWQFSYQYSGDCGEYQAFDEGAANWAAEYVYPANEARSYSWMVEGPWLGWQHWDTDGYELWAFDLFMSETFGDKTIPALYEKFQTELPLDAVDSILPEGFARQWPAFTKAAWNQEPVAKSFTQWDEFTRVPGCGESWSCPAKQIDLKPVQLPANLPPLSRQYYRLTVPGQTVRYLKFTNPLAGQPAVSVQAFVKLADGTWHDQTWDTSEVTFCRDEPDQNVTDLIVMYSNSDSDVTGSPVVATPTMTGKTSCGPVVVTGTITYKDAFPSDEFGLKGGDTASGTFKIKAESLYMPPAGTAWTSIGSTYSVHDNYYETGTDSHQCTITKSGSIEGTGRLYDPSAQKPGQLIVYWGPTYSPYVGFGITVVKPRAVRTTSSGPLDECANGTTTATNPYQFQPICWNELNTPKAEPGAFGPFKGDATKGQGTITIHCGGKAPPGNVYSVTGNLTVKRMPVGG